MIESTMKTLWVVLGIMVIISILCWLMPVKKNMPPLARKETSVDDLQELAENVFLNMRSKQCGYYIRPSVDTVNNVFLIKEMYYEKDVCDLVLHEFRIPIIHGRDDLNIKNLNYVKDAIFSEFCCINGRDIRRVLKEKTNNEFIKRVKHNNPNYIF